jgi:hypothetical protein
LEIISTACLTKSRQDLCPAAQTITRPGRPIRTLLAEVPTCPFLSQPDATITNARFCRGPDDSPEWL